ncbi:MAG: GNAT family N-acetyltransferase [Clostridia bacterium]|nr:GNAT family N-acetyltransferase [Clostridia bacterium]
MIDQSTPAISLILYKCDTDVYPRVSLPAGYSFAYYREGDAQKWAEIECDVGQFKTLAEGVDCFTREFLNDYPLDARDHTLFVIAPDGEYVATASLWCWEFIGKPCYRAHWLAVKDNHAGRGIAQALLARVLALYNERYHDGCLYLLTSTQNYPAISIYHKFGFREYCGPHSPVAEMSDEAFMQRNTQAMALLEKKLAEFHAAK